MMAIRIDESQIENQTKLASTTMRSVSVVIPFSKPEAVGNAIESVLAQDYPSELVEIIVVGKGSSNLREKWPQLIAIDEGPIYEPGRARNLGASKASGQVLLFLDDDCEAQEGWIRANLAELENPEVGAVSGMIQGKSKAFFARCVDYANFSLCQIERRQERPVCSASFGIRKDVFERVGGFDATMRVHEDIDICYRLEERGLVAVYQPNVKVLHDHGRDSLRSMVQYLYYGGREGGLVVENKYRDRSRFNQWITWFNHPILYGLMVLPFAIGATLQTIRANVREHKEVLWLSPFIFAGKLSCHVGILSFMVARRLRVPWATYGAVESVKKLIEYSLLKQTFTTPRKLTLFVTSQCNARCRHCFYWKSLNQRVDLTFDEIAELSRVLGKMDKLLISGGEPFLRNDLPEICGLFVKNNDLGIVSIPTNGLRPGRICRQTRHILEAADGRMVNISLSLDGLSEVHDELRGVRGSFARAIETYSGLHAMQGEFRNLHLRVNSVVTNRTYPSILALIDEISTLLPGVNVPALTLLRGSPCDLKLALPSIQDLRVLYNYKTSRIPGNSPWIWRFADWANFTLSLETLRRNVQVVPCEAGRISGVVESNGDVKHCEMLQPIGNLRTAGFLETWNSTKAKLERESIVDKCCYCTHECNLFPSLLAHPIRGAAVLARAAITRP